MAFLLPVMAILDCTGEEAEWKISSAVSLRKRTQNQPCHMTDTEPVCPPACPGRRRHMYGSATEGRTILLRGHHARGEFQPRMVLRVSSSCGPPSHSQLDFGPSSRGIQERVSTFESVMEAYFFSMQYRYFAPRKKSAFPTATGDASIGSSSRFVVNSSN